MSDEKISQMPSPPGGVAASDLVPLIRPGNINNFAAPVSALTGATAITPAPVDTRNAPQSYTLPAGGVGSPMVVFDRYGNAHANPITILGSGVPTPVINMNYGSIPFFWTGSVWFPF
jgi:hypothetical protein